MPVHKRIFRGRFRQPGRKYLALPLLQISDIVMFDAACHSCSTVGCQKLFGRLQEASMGRALCGLVPSFSRHWYATKTSRQQQICWTIVSFYFFQAGDNYRRGICSPDLISYLYFLKKLMTLKFLDARYLQFSEASQYANHLILCFFNFIPWRSSQPNHHLGEYFWHLFYPHWTSKSNII